jgi:FixJ family two-component response regulator
MHVPLRGARESCRMANEQIAVLDDDASIRMGLARLLGAYSYRVGAYAEGQEFIDSLRVHPPDCLILDLNMEPMNGGEVLQYLADTGNQIPTIILTGRDSAERRETCRRAGAVAFLVKPVQADQLVRTIQAALIRSLLA